MLREAVGYTCEVKTAQETAKEAEGISLCETGGGNEREMKDNFVFKTSFNCTVLYKHWDLENMRECY